MSNLTDALIRSAKPRDRYYDLNDRGTPLMLRVKQNGEKVWLWRGRIEGKQTTRIIGSYPEMKLSEAKLEALRLKSAAKSGAIKAHGEMHPHHRQKAPSVREALSRYHADKLTSRATGDEIKSMLDRKIIPKFGDHAVVELTYRELNQHFEDLKIEGYNGPALNRVLAATKAFLKWCVRSNFIDTNPAANIEKKVEEIPRRRVLVDHELAAILHCLPDLGKYGPPIALLLHTGTRKSDIFGLCWDEVVTRANGEVELHIKKTKSGVGHIVWLSPQARKFLPVKPKAARGHHLVFPDLCQDGGKLYPKMRALAAKAAGVPLEHWTLHDFRTAITTCLADRQGRGSAFFSDRALDALLAHVPTGVTRKHYNMSMALAERMEMLTIWSDHLDECEKRFPKNNARIIRQQLEEV